MTVRVIDCETTDTDAAVDAVIEIASVDLQKDGTITSQQSTLVPAGHPGTAGGLRRPHLLDEDLAGAPPLTEVVNLFMGADAHVAHNADFERSFLKHLLGDALWRVLTATLVEVLEPGKKPARVRDG